MRGLLLGAWLSVMSVPLEAQRSPYAGQESRSIKALDSTEIRSLLNGEGMGYARAAELNRYPGPRHVLDLGDELGLTAVQRSAVEKIFATMQHAARGVGREVVAGEAALDSLFASGKASPASVDSAAGTIARLEGVLRATHLKAHIEVTRLLTPEQIAAYETARGYHAAAGHGGH